MNLSSLSVDVLLYLIKFVKPVDRFNLALSGILKGFEYVNKGINLRKRVEYCEAELGLRRDSMCELEIRSLKFKHPPDERLLKILERLAGEGYLQNNRKLGVDFDLKRSSRFAGVICSMENLEELNLFDQELPLDYLAHVFQSCSKIIELDIWTRECKTPEMDEHLKYQLRSGFQKLRYFSISCFIDNDSWPVIQEMLTWLKECVQLCIFNDNDNRDISNLEIDGSLMLDPNLAEGLQISNLMKYVPAALVKWILSVCLNIHFLQLSLISKKPHSLHNEIACLKKMKKLEITVNKASQLKEIVRSCRQVEIIRMDVTRLTLRDLAELEPAENMTDITLNWENCWGKGPSMKEVLPVLKTWRHMSRLTFADLPKKISFPPFEVLVDFILGMKQLSHLHITPDYQHTNFDQLEMLRDKVNEFILPRRPNFKFHISHMDY